MENERLDTAALKAAMERAGFGTNQSELARKLNLSSTTVLRWIAGSHVPRGEHLTALCQLLGVTPAQLFGDAGGAVDERAAAVALVRRVFGRGAAEAVEHLAKLTPHHRAIAAGRIVGWVEGLLEQEERLQRRPRTQFERDAAQLGEDDDLLDWPSEQPESEQPALDAKPSSEPEK